MVAWYFLCHCKLIVWWHCCSCSLGGKRCGEPYFSFLIRPESPPTVTCVVEDEGEDAGVVFLLSLPLPRWSLAEWSRDKDSETRNEAYSLLSLFVFIGVVDIAAADLTRSESSPPSSSLLVSISSHCTVKNETVMGREG
ncbi:unnamed protein product [Linum trigynum]|uniref:Secreted protein n=1 Tax=Linum trigynum TaxID=586398 RepID=A0AAV2EGZ3_9ROSI